MAQVPGGFTDPSPATAKIQQIADEVKAQVEEKTGKCYVDYKAVLYRSQIVAGTNYLIKVDVGVDYIHLRVFRALPTGGDMTVLRGLQLHKTKCDPLEPFPDDQTTC